jgi:hypothetical protein
MRLRPSTILSACLALALLATLAVSWSSGPVDAQDQTDDRLAALETRAAKQDREIRRLKDRVAALEAEVAVTPTPQRGTEAHFDGEGQTVTEPIDLIGGRYKITATCAGGGSFFLRINPVATSEIVVSTLSGLTPFEGEEVQDLQGGRYAFELDCDGVWTLRVERLR